MSAADASEPDLQPTLIGATIALRPTQAQDWDPLFAVASDPLIWAGHPAHDRWKEPIFRRYFDQALASRGSLTIRDRCTENVIGASRYYRDHAGPGEVEIGWTFLAREYWGGAVNRELKRLMIDHALRWFATVIFVVGEGNLRSRRALEKIGAELRPEEQRREMAGLPVRHVVYEVRKVDP